MGKRAVLVSEAAKTLGQRGGQARAKRLSKERRSEIARLGAKARKIKLTTEQRSQAARKASLARWGNRKKT